MTRLWVVLCLAGCASAPVKVDDAPVAPSAPVVAPEVAKDTRLKVLFFSATRGYRHESIEPALEALKRTPGWRVDQTEDPIALMAVLRETDVVVFLHTTGDVLDEAQERVFEAWVRRGGGFVGVHSASDTEYGWPFYGTLVGAYFSKHPEVQPATVLPVGGGVAVAHLPTKWSRVDEWYDFKAPPKNVTVTLSVDEKSYRGGGMGPSHPLAWHHTVGEGRAYYSALGHTAESWADPLLIRHVVDAVSWAGKRQ